VAMPGIAICVVSQGWGSKSRVPAGDLGIKPGIWFVEPEFELFLIGI